jgi:DNA-binding LacI/PurR family transcriptional regulator
MMGTKVTYAEIAAKAKVSEATVSRVLNGDERVKADRAARVQKAVSDLGYTKNRIAAALASGRSGLIAIVIDDDLTLFSDPFWARVSTGVSRVLMENDLQTLLMVSPVTSIDSPVSHYLQAGEVDGAIFFQVHNEELVKKLRAQKMSVVVAGTPATGTKITYADTDNFGGAVLATRHLIEKGCKHLVTITGDIDASAGRQRLDGFKKAIAEANLTIAKNNVHFGDFTFESGRAAVAQLIKNKVKFDGIFAANDLMALGAIAELREREISVPEHVKIVGFDDSVMAQASVPPLTTIQQDIEGLGAAVAELMIAKLKGETPTPRILSTILIERETA